MLRATETGDDPAYFEKLEERRRRRNCQIQQRVLAAVILSAVFYVLFLVVSQVYRGKRDRRFAGSYSRRNRTNSGTGGVVRGL